MRRLTRRRAVPYKSPRLFSMLALLVCLLLMMNSLRNMRGPGQNAQRIISNLDKSIKQVHAPLKQQPDPQPPDPQPPDPQPSELPAVVAPTSPSDGEVQSDTPAARASNLAEIPNLNLREDLELQDWLGLVQDGTLKMQKLEMPAYWRMLSVVKKSQFGDLLKGADSKVRFNDLYSSASKHRSKLFTLTLNIRKITRYETEDNPAGVEELFEVWGWSETSKAWLYVFVTPELPPGLNADTPVNQTAKFAGYFFKLQGYQPGAAKPNAKPELAPLLIGKFELTKPSQRAAANLTTPIEMIAGAIILLVGVTAILLRIFVFRAKKPKLSRVAPQVNCDMFPEGSLASRDKRQK